MDVNFLSLDVTGQAKLIRDMVVCQLGLVEKEVIGDEKVIATPRTTMGIRSSQEFMQTHSPGSPFKLLFKTHKRWVRQRQLKTLISQAKKPEKRKREEEPENDDQEELSMEPIALSAAEKEALTLEKLERKRKLEALASKHKKRRYL